jgi:alanine racemase
MVSLAHLRLGQTWAKENNVKRWPVHLKLDTGMHRLGLTPDEDEAAADLLKDGALDLVTVMSHLAGADDPSLDAATKEQLSRFQSRTAKHYPGVPAHILNSAGTTRVNDLLGSERPSPLREWIRVGLSMYGLGTGALDLGLTPVLELRSVVSRLVNVPPGEGSGYGWTDAAGHARTLAVLAVGYADGYPRNLGNGRGQVHWKGRLLPTVGRVCMDMMTVDATGLDIQAGDDVLLWGEDLRLEECAERAHTIPYEMLTRLGPRVQRVMLR